MGAVGPGEAGPRSWLEPCAKDSPVSRTTGPDGRYDNWARLVPVLVGTPCGHKNIVGTASGETTTGITRTEPL